MEKLFHLKEHGTTVRTEIVAGLTTYMTMAYIVAFNPNLLTYFGSEGQDLWNAVFMATCIASAIGCFCMGFLASKPFVMAPAMGVNSFFALVAANLVAITGMTYLQSFRSALVLIFIEGVVFIALTLLNIREKIVNAIPMGVRLGIGPAIGLALISYTALKLCTGKAKDVSVLTYVLSVIFLLKFFLAL
jgi:AGZA family xanthine/uracil permease-like MFS transporter